MSGGALMGFTNNGEVTSNDVELDFRITASGATDGGYTFGANIDIDRAQSGETGALQAENADDFNAFVSGAFGTLTMGSIDHATDGTGMADIGYQGIGVDDVAEANKLGGAGDADWAYAVSMNGISLTLTGDSVDENYSATVGFDVSGTSITVGTIQTRNSATDSDTTTNVTIGTTLGGIGLTVYAEQFDDDSANTTTDAYGIHATYAIDAATTLAVAFADNDVATDAAYGIGLTHSLGGGLNVVGGVGSVGDESVWDLGLTMSF